MQTKRCVYCLKKPARIWSGHVIHFQHYWNYRTRTQHIIAGWCSKTCQRKGRADGFVGLYKWRMGREEDELD